MAITTPKDPDIFNQTDQVARFANALDASWRQVLADEFEKPYIPKLIAFLKERELAGATIFPEKRNIFSAFNATPYEKVKVVIIGQDPYHGPKQAHGMSFSVLPGINPPPSLKNIYKELASDLGLPIASTGYLLPWAQQGVLLLNAILTVEQGAPHSHHSRGWEEFTDAVVLRLIKSQQPIVFLLWGQTAQKKLLSALGGLDSTSATKHLILTAAHPSPYSASKFLGCRHFSQANAFLESHGLGSIDWSLTP
jgi:uracil-DNA glycosylase